LILTRGLPIFYLDDKEVAMTLSEKAKNFSEACQLVELATEQKATLTIGQVYDPACSFVETEEQAKKYFDLLVNYAVTIHSISVEEATKNELLNIGYYAGYYDNDTRIKMQKLFGAIHPIFGRVFPTADEALEIGKRIGEKMRND